MSWPTDFLHLKNKRALAWLSHLLWGSFSWIIQWWWVYKVIYLHVAKMAKWTSHAKIHSKKGAICNKSRLLQISHKPQFSCALHIAMNPLQDKKSTLIASRGAHKSPNPNLTLKYWPRCTAGQQRKIIHYFLMNSILMWNIYSLSNTICQTFI